MSNSFIELSHVQNCTLKRPLCWYRISRLQAKYDNISHSLGGRTPTQHEPTIIPAPITRRRTGRTMVKNGQPKLFGGGLEEYLDAVKQDIPLIVKSCIRVINLYGLHHQGIFRVSGSKVRRTIHTPPTIAKKWLQWMLLASGWNQQFSGSFRAWRWSFGWYVWCQWYKFYCWSAQNVPERTERSSILHSVLWPIHGACK